MIVINLVNATTDLSVALLRSPIDIYQLPTYLYTAALVLTSITYLILIVFPRQSWANFWVAGIVVPVVLGALYSIVMAVYFFLPAPDPELHIGVSNPLDFMSLAGMRRMFLKDGLLLAGFLDLLLVPLVVSAWMARKAAQIRMPYIFLLPSILLTMAAPGTGVVVFVLLASLRGRLSEIVKFEGQPPINTAPVFARPGLAGAQ